MTEKEGKRGKEQEQRSVQQVSEDRDVLEEREGKRGKEQEQRSE